MNSSTPICFKTFILKRRGKKYFNCTVNGNEARLIINDITKDLSINNVVVLKVKDLSFVYHTRIILKFEPLAIKANYADPLNWRLSTANKSRRQLSYKS
jgi:hypothetical protein